MIPAQNSPVLANEADLYLAPGGPIFRLMQRIGVARAVGLSVHRRIFALWLITWFPMCVFSCLQGIAFGDTARGSFLLDFAAYARFFVALPILIIAEGVAGGRLTQAGLQFVRDGHVRHVDYPAFEHAITRLARRRESIWATLAIMALALFGAWKFTAEAASGGGLIGWQSLTLPEGHAFRYSLAGLWNHLVALPVALFLLYCWLWRIVIWTLFLRDVARLDLQLVPTHADRAGGLGFLETAHNSFGIFAFGIGCVVSAEVAFCLVYEGARLPAFQVPAIVLLVLTQLLFLGPLLVFGPVMTRARRAALHTYGSLVVQYNRTFQKKWTESPEPKDEPLLGTGDIQSLADLGNSFRFVEEMNIVPVGRRAMIRLALATILPALPLSLLVMPIGELLSGLAKLVL